MPHSTESIVHTISKALLLASCVLAALCLWQDWPADASSARVMEHNGEDLLPSSPRPPLKVILMVGQSNMQGHGYMLKQDDDGNYLNGTLPWMIETYPEKYAKLKDTTGNWTVRNDVWIAYNRQNLDNVRSEINQHGPLMESATSASLLTWDY